MRLKIIIYILAAVLTVSLIGDEILYENSQTLQNEVREYGYANNQMMQKASLVSNTMDQKTDASPAP